MSDPVLIALFAGLPGTITAIGSFINSMKLNAIKRTADVTSKNVNGRMDQMLTIQHEKSYLQGVNDAQNNEVSKDGVQSRNIPT